MAIYNSNRVSKWVSGIKKEYAAPPVVTPGGIQKRKKNKKGFLISISE